MHRLSRNRSKGLSIPSLIFDLNRGSARSVNSGEDEGNGIFINKGHMVPKISPHLASLRFASNEKSPPGSGSAK